jgi:peptide/nickel transport system permease protein
MAMLAYLLRRVLYAIPIILGVNFLTFALFFMVNTPDDMARLHLGQKYITQEAVNLWKHSKGYDKPLFFNEKAEGINKVSDTLFFQKSIALFSLNFGVSDSGRNIGSDISERMWPSLALAVPTLLMGLFINICLALVLVFFRRTYLDVTGLTLCITLMSISALFYIISGQYFVGRILKLVPISGYQGGLNATKFLILPIIIGALANLGAGARWYRILFLEEINKEYVRTARAKGLSERLVLFRHVLQNALIPILTGVVVLIPLLFLGSLIMESFFGIPGLGSYTIEAIRLQDFEIVRSMVFLGTVFYLIGLVLTDISYMLVDPRIRL